MSFCSDCLCLSFSGFSVVFVPDFHLRMCHRVEVWEGTERRAVSAPCFLTSAGLRVMSNFFKGFWGTENVYPGSGRVFNLYERSFAFEWRNWPQHDEARLRVYVCLEGVVGGGNDPVNVHWEGVLCDEDIRAFVRNSSCYTGCPGQMQGHIGGSNSFVLRDDVAEVCFEATQGKVGYQATDVRFFVGGRCLMDVRGICLSRDDISSLVGLVSVACSGGAWMDDMVWERRVADGALVFEIASPDAEYGALGMDGDGVETVETEVRIFARHENDARSYFGLGVRVLIGELKEFQAQIGCYMGGINQLVWHSEERVFTEPLGCP